jgi:hypothetical protein
MQRGTLTLNSSEAKELVSNVDLTRYTDKPLYSKLTSISDGSQEEYNILLSEDELEMIMDEIGFVDESSNPILSSAMKKISELLVSFRTS